MCHERHMHGLQSTTCRKTWNFRQPCLHVCTCSFCLQFPARQRHGMLTPVSTALPRIRHRTEGSCNGSGRFGGGHAAVLSGVRTTFHTRADAPLLKCGCPRHWTPCCVGARQTPGGCILQTNETDSHVEPVKLLFSFNLPYCERTVVAVTL